MKTVMKKMFSLLLVAVLLIGVMPFQAFAAEGTVHVSVRVNGTEVATFSEPFSGTPNHASLQAAATAKLPSIYPMATFSSWTESGGNAFDWATVTDGWVINANFTSPYCSTCGTYDHNTGDTHCADCHWGYGHSSTCTRNCDLGYNCTSQYHKSGCKYNVCENCGFTKHGSTPCCSECKQLGGNHAPTCTSGCDKSATCNTKWAFKHKADCETLHTCTVCSTLGHFEKNCPNVIETCCGVQKGSAHRSDCVATYCTGKYNCPNTKHTADCKWELCNVEGCTKKETEAHTEHTGVTCGHNNQCTFWKGHTGNHSYQCPTIGCDKAVGHSGNCSNDPVEIPGDSDLHIFVNLYTADTLVKTTHLKSYEDISSETLIYDFISDHAQELEAELEEDGHYGYSWSGHVYDKDNKGNPVTMKAKVGKGATVHINAYTDQDLIYIYVHNSRSMSNLRIIQLPGKKVGETVTKSEVTNAVAKYFNVSSLAMYSEQGWEDYVDGHSVDAVSSLKVTSDPYFIDVKVAGTAKSTSGTKADSSNPKTGDTIYAPVMVMGASVSALAVLFYLNKKRAY